MNHEELFALVKRIDSMAVRLPPGTKRLAAAIIEPLESQIAALTAERDSLRAQVAELEKEAARLNWMENKNTCYYVNVQSQPHGDEIFSNHGVGLRAAIDAAIAAEKEKP